MIRRRLLSEGHWHSANTGARVSSGQCLEIQSAHLLAEYFGSPTSVRRISNSANAYATLRIASSRLSGLDIRATAATCGPRFNGGPCPAKILLTMSFAIGVGARCDVFPFVFGAAPAIRLEFCTAMMRTSDTGCIADRRARCSQHLVRRLFSTENQWRDSESCARMGARVDSSLAFIRTSLLC